MVADLKDLGFFESRGEMNKRRLRPEGLSSFVRSAPARHSLGGGGSPDRTKKCHSVLPARQWQAGLCLRGDIISFRVLARRLCGGFNFRAFVIIFSLCASLYALCASVTPFRE